jgi:hypothetical protein
VVFQGIGDQFLAVLRERSLAGKESKGKGTFFLTTYKDHSLRVPSAFLVSSLQLTALAKEAAFLDESSLGVPCSSL